MNTFLAIVIVIVMFVLVFVVKRMLSVKAAENVVKMFRARNAFNRETSLSIEQLGLKPKGMFQRMFEMRDYKPQALRALIDQGIIEETVEGKLYLSEQKLADYKTGKN